MKNPLVKTTLAAALMSVLCFAAHAESALGQSLHLRLTPGVDRMVLRTERMTDRVLNGVTRGGERLTAARASGAQTRDRRAELIDFRMDRAAERAAARQTGDRALDSMMTEVREGIENGADRMAADLDRTGARDPDLDRDQDDDDFNFERDDFERVGDRIGNAADDAADDFRDVRDDAKADYRDVRDDAKDDFDDVFDRNG